MPHRIPQEGLKEHQVEVFRLAKMVWGDLRETNKLVEKFIVQKGEGVLGCHFVKRHSAAGYQAPGPAARGLQRLGCSVRDLENASDNVEAMAYVLKVRSLNSK